VEIFLRYKLVIKITNSTVINKLQSYSHISALGPEGHCTSLSKRVMCISCRGSGSCGQGEGVKNPIFWGHHKWMAPKNCFMGFSC